MKAKILSLNVGGPEVLVWDGKSIETSMFKKPVDVLSVKTLSIDGDRFANANFHGVPDSVLYIYGRSSIDRYLSMLGRDHYAGGELGENITADSFDEREISVGDRFKIGDVIAEATFPRIPCSKLNIRMQHPQGQKLMIDSETCGVYLRILQPGTIRKTDSVERIAKSASTFTIADVYRHVVGGEKLTPAVYDRAVANGAFPAERLAKWAKILTPAQ